MEANSGVELCRVTVVAPRTRMDLALPTDTPLSDLLPTLLRYAGENPDDPAFLRGGWVLQRLGESAFDPSLRLSGLGIRDGDVLHLRHREMSIPEFAFDDVADAIAVATRDRRAAWQPVRRPEHRAGRDRSVLPARCRGRAAERTAVDTAGDRDAGRLDLSSRRRHGDGPGVRPGAGGRAARRGGRAVRGGGRASWPSASTIRSAPSGRLSC